MTRRPSEPSAEEDQIAHEAIGAAIEVHRILGPGLLEAVYEQALCVELTRRSIPFDRQPTVALSYKGEPVGHGRLDLLVGGCVVVELKAVETLLPVHQAQVLSYLKAAGYRLGLLVNFNVPLLRDGVKRLVSG